MLNTFINNLPFLWLTIYFFSLYNIYWQYYVTYSWHPTLTSSWTVCLDVVECVDVNSLCISVLILLNLHSFIWSKWRKFMHWMSWFLAIPSFLLNWICCILTSRIGTSLQKCHHHHHLHYYFVLQQLPRTPHFYFVYYFFFPKSSEVTFPKSIILLFCSFSLVSEKFWSLLPPGHPYPSYLLFLLFSIIKDPFTVDEKHSHFSFSTSPRTKQEFTRHLVHFRHVRGFEIFIWGWRYDLRPVDCCNLLQGQQEILLYST